VVELESADDSMTLPLAIQTAWPAAFLAAVPLLFWLAGRSRTRTQLGRRHLLVATILRSVAIVSLALALMRPQWNAESGDVSVVYALDISRSVSSSFIEAAIKWIEQADRKGAPARARYLAFADHAVMLQKPGDVRSLAVTEGRPHVASADATVIDQTATNLEQALDTALMGLDRDRAKRVVLLTDGNQTAGDVWRVLPRLTRAHVRVYPIPPKLRDDNDAWIAGIEVPVDVHFGEPVTVTVRVFSAVETSAQVSLKDAKMVLGTRNVQLRAGFNRIAFEAKLARAGTVTLSAEVVAKGDTVSENNRMQQSVWVNARPRILYVEGGEAEGAHYLADALTGQGIDTRVIAPAALPGSASELAVYDAVILSDTPAKALAPDKMQAIESYVRDLGGGLLFASGENVHGELGYSDTAVEKVLPVQFRAQEKRKDLALVIALDRSYSMKGRKMEMAKEATRAALDLLEEQHRFGVVAFDSQTYIAVPMQYVRSRRKAEDQISRIQASGQTNIYPALGIIYRLLQKTDSKAKHVILLSDGNTHPADFETLVKRMAGEKIVVSTVAVGADADRVLMSDIAKWGKGRAYVAENAESIPQIFIEETERAVRSNLLEESFRPVVKHRSAAFRGLEVDKLPELRGFVSSKARDHAEVLLAAPSGAPLLVRWQYGLGKAVAFTSDVKNRWAANWLDWPGYGKFWAQQLREITRRDSGEALDFRVVREGGEAVIRLSVLTPDGNFRNGLVPQVRITRADGSNAIISLEQTGAGTYQMRMPFGSSRQTERFELVDSAGLPKQASLRTGARMLHQDYPDEYRAFPPDIELLSALARATGGKVAPSIAEVFARQGDESRTTTTLWPWFAVLALIFYLLDIAVRRSPLAWRWLES
jgi:Ca-activated chloride channel family protein